jgi:hypothetical protein
LIAPFHSVCQTDFALAQEVKSGEKYKLHNNDLLSICGLSFSFEVNTTLYSKIQKQLKGKS